MLRRDIVNGNNCKLSSSTPCLTVVTNEQNNDGQDCQALESKRKFTRKPDNGRLNEHQRNRRVTESISDLAGFFSPTHSKGKQLFRVPIQNSSFIKSTPMIPESTLASASEQHDASTAGIPIKRRGFNQNNGPRMSARFVRGEVKQVAISTNLNGKNQDILTKKIQILEIQLEAANLENSRLKEHLQLLRENNQELKNKLSSLLGNHNQGTNKPKNSSQEELTQLQRMLEVSKNQCMDLKRSISQSRREWEQQKYHLNSCLESQKENQRKAKEANIQLQSIITILRRENSIQKTANQQVSVRLWSISRQLAQLQSQQRQRRHETKNILKKHRIAKCNTMRRLQYEETDDQLFQLSPEHS